MADVEKYVGKEEFMLEMESLRPDFFFPEAWNKEQRARAAELVRPQRMRTTLFASIPLRCAGDKCVFADICPLLAEGLAPVGDPCPIEMSAVHQFMTELCEELEVSPDNLSEMAIVRDLVDNEIQTQRKTWILSKEHFIQENIIGVDKEGRPIFTKQLHLAVELEDKLMRRKRELRNQLLATREARAKAGQGQLDTAQTISKLLSDVETINRAKEKALKARLGYEERDEYIEAEAEEAEWYPEEDDTAEES